MARIGALEEHGHHSIFVSLETRPEYNRARNKKGEKTDKYEIRVREYVQTHEVPSKDGGD